MLKRRLSGDTSPSPKSVMTPTAPIKKPKKKKDKKRSKHRDHEKSKKLKTSSDGAAPAAESPKHPPLERIDRTTVFALIPQRDTIVSHETVKFGTRHGATGLPHARVIKERIYFEIYCGIHIFHISFACDEAERFAKAAAFTREKLEEGTLTFKQLCTQLAHQFAPIKTITNSTYDRKSGANYSCKVQYFVHPEAQGFQSIYEVRTDKESQRKHLSQYAKEHSTSEFKSKVCQHRQTKPPAIGKVDPINKTKTSGFNPILMRDKGRYRLPTVADKDLGYLTLFLLGYRDTTELNTGLLACAHQVTKALAHPILLHEAVQQLQIHHQVYRCLETVETRATQIIALMEDLLFRWNKGRMTHTHHLPTTYKNIDSSGDAHKWGRKAKDPWSMASQDDRHWLQKSSDQLELLLKELHSYHTGSKAALKFRKELQTRIAALKTQLNPFHSDVVVTALSSNDIKTTFLKMTTEQKVDWFFEKLTTSIRDAKHHARLGKKFVFTAHELFFSAGEYPVRAISEETYAAIKIRLAEFLKDKPDVLVVLPVNVVSHKSADDKGQLVSDLESFKEKNEDNEGFSLLVDAAKRAEGDITTVTSKVLVIGKDHEQEIAKSTPNNPSKEHSDVNVSHVDDEALAEETAVIYAPGHLTDHQPIVTWQDERIRIFQCLEAKLLGEKDTSDDSTLSLVVSATINLTKKMAASQHQSKWIVQADAAGTHLWSQANYDQHISVFHAGDDEPRHIKSECFYNSDKKSMANELEIDSPWVLFIIRTTFTFFHHINNHLKNSKNAKAFNGQKEKSDATRRFVKSRKGLVDLAQHYFIGLMCTIKHNPDSIAAIAEHYPELWALLKKSIEDFANYFDEPLDKFQNLNGSYVTQSIDTKTAKTLQRAALKLINKETLTDEEEDQYQSKLANVTPAFTPTRIKKISVRMKKLPTQKQPTPGRIAMRPAAKKAVEKSKKDLEKEKTKKLLRKITTQLQKDPEPKTSANLSFFSKQHQLRSYSTELRKVTDFKGCKKELQTLVETLEKHSKKEGVNQAFLYVNLTTPLLEKVDNTLKFYRKLHALNSKLRAIAESKSAKKSEASIPRMTR